LNCKLWEESTEWVRRRRRRSSACSRSTPSTRPSFSSKVRSLRIFAAPDTYLISVLLGLALFSPQGYLDLPEKAGRQERDPVLNPNGRRQDRRRGQEEGWRLHRQGTSLARTCLPSSGTDPSSLPLPLSCLIDPGCRYRQSALPRVPHLRHPHPPHHHLLLRLRHGRRRGRRRSGVARERSGRGCALPAGHNRCRCGRPASRTVGHVVLLGRLTCRALESIPLFCLSRPFFVPFDCTVDSRHPCTFAS
jgi:hypothetical protein